MAYYDNDKDTTFYYSSASIGRCVEKEKEIYITDLKENKLSEQASNPNIYNSFQGIYVSSMQSEPLYSYRFIFKNAITNETTAGLFSNGTLTAVAVNAGIVSAINGGYIIILILLSKRQRVEQRSILYHKHNSR